MKKYADNNMEQLKALCKERGLKVSGRKDELVRRLRLHDESAGHSPEIFSSAQEPVVSWSKASSTSTYSKPLYLHMRSTNLINYFNFGCFYPLALEESEVYRRENRAKDILSIFEDHIVFGEGPLGRLEESDVLIQCVLDGIDVREFEESKIFYCSEPIPVSRVKSIYFRSETARAAFLSSVNAFPDSYIPASLCKIYAPTKDEPNDIDSQRIQLPANANLEEWKVRLDLFDRILGMLAFIKNASIFCAERESRFVSPSPGLFAALRQINPTDGLPPGAANAYLRPLLRLGDFEVNNVNRAIFKAMIDRIYSGQLFDLSVAIEILTNEVEKFGGNGDTSDVREALVLFNQLRRHSIPYKAVLQRESVRGNLPVLALLFLAKFPNKSRQNTDKQAVRIAMIDNDFAFSLPVSEYVLAVLGLYYGYKNMIKEDTNLKFNDEYFESLALAEQSIKFKLEGYLDRFIIESSFQFAVKRSPLYDSFPFLKWDEVQRERKAILHSTSTLYDYRDESFIVFDQKVTNIHRVDKREKVFDRIDAMYPDKIDDASYLATFIRNYLYFDKRQAIDWMRRHRDSISIAELERVIDLDSLRKKGK